MNEQFLNIDLNCRKKVLESPRKLSAHPWQLKKITKLQIFKKLSGLGKEDEHALSVTCCLHLRKLCNVNSITMAKIRKFEIS